MVQLSSLVAEFDKFWPANHADEWDRVGLISGSGTSEITKVLVSVDITDEVVDEAIAHGVQLVLSHHPLLLKPVHSIAEDTLKGAVLTRLIRHDIAVFSAHTNADIQHDGASTLMAKAFGLVDLEPLVATQFGFGHGVIGNLPIPLPLADFALSVSKALPKVARSIAFSGQADAVVSRIAICSGAGDSFLPQVLASTADVYVTSDLRHHPTLDAVGTPRKVGPLKLIDVSHWAAESLWVEAARDRINTLGLVTAVTSTINTDPWTQEVN